MPYNRDGIGDDRPEIDRTALRTILLDALDAGTVQWGSRIERIMPGQGGINVFGDGWQDRQ